MEFDKKERLTVEYDPDKIVTNCHIIDIADLENVDQNSYILQDIMPYYKTKAQKIQSRKKSLAELGVGVLLARVLNITTNEAIMIDEYGKPFLADEKSEIGISHAGNLVLLATSNGSIGVDVEPLPDSLSAYHYYALKKVYGNQLSDIVECEKDLTPYVFCKLWTQAEAAVKLDGRGLRLDPVEHLHVISEVYFCTYEYKKHIITVATYEVGEVAMKEQKWMINRAATTDAVEVKGG